MDWIPNRHKLATITKNDDNNTYTLTYGNEKKNPFEKKNPLELRVGDCISFIGRSKNNNINKKEKINIIGIITKFEQNNDTFYIKYKPNFGFNNEEDYIHSVFLNTIEKSDKCDVTGGRLKTTKRTNKNKKTKKSKKVKSRNMRKMRQ